MKKALFIVWCIWLFQGLSAQTINKAEYFIDSDPGIGLGTALTANSVNDTARVNFSVSTSSLSAGFHYVFVRFRNSSGTWGLHQGTPFYILPSNPQSSLQINAAEYFVDTDPGLGNGTPVTISSPTDTANIAFNLNTSALSGGFHNVFVRYRYTNGTWSLYEGRPFYILPTNTSAVQQINAAEYFVDTDPGVGNATALSVGAATDTAHVAFNLSTNSLAQGFHYLFVRYRYANGTWSLYDGRPFYILPTNAQASRQINAAEYFIDTDPGVGHATALTVGAATDTAHVAINLSTGSLTQGFHNIFVRYRYTDGTWGLYDGRPFYILPTNAQTSRQINAAEYFIDIDPGVGNATSLSVGAATDTAHVAISMSTSLLTQGFHNVFVRYRYTDGTWGLYDGRPFYILPAVSPSPQKIAAAEYFIDTDPGLGHATAVSIATPVDTASIAINLNTSSLTSGFHNLFVRYKYTNGTWGLYDGRPFYILPNNIVNHQQINYAEYFVDTDPGVGNATQVPINPAVDTANLALNITVSNSLSIDSHHLFIRYRYVNGTWGLYEGRKFSVCNTITSAVISANGPVTFCTTGTVVLKADTTQNGTGVTYQWQKNGTNISGATSSSYTATTAGTYICLFTKSGCGVGSNSITVTFNTAPVATITPAGPIVFCASSGTLLSANTGTGYTYQWRVNGNPIGGATNATYTATASGTYTVIVSTGASCSATSTGVVATASGSVSTNLTASVCPGHSYNFNGTILTSAGTYNDTITTGSGCDSIITLTLTVLTNPATTVNQSICQGQSYYGHNATGTYVDTFAAANGCDSIRTLHLTVTGALTSLFTQTICNGQSFAGYNSSGTYVDTFTSSGGCDSIRTLILTVLPPITSDITATICQGQSYAGHTATGTYTDVYTASNSCDSTRTLHLTVTPSVTSNITATICQGQSYAGHTSTGTYVDTYPASGGCDSVRTLQLTVLPAITSSVTQNVCSGESYAGHSSTGTFTDTYTAVNGCDSVRTLHLTVLPVASTTATQTICAGEVFEGHNATGVYADTFTAANGCDSIHTLNLTVIQVSHTAESRAICQGQSYGGHNSSGTYIDTLTSANGCDSIRTLTLTVSTVITSSVTHSICEGESFEGYNATGTYIDTFVADGGCDSVRTLHLTVTPTAHTSVTQIICQGQSYEGYTVTGNYVDTLTATGGCDSIRTLHLTVMPIAHTTYTQTICQGDTFMGHTGGGDYVDTLASGNSCDSIVTLHLVVNAAPAVPTITHTGDTLTSSAALHYQWYREGVLMPGDTNQKLILSQIGHYTVIVTDANGCTAQSAVINVLQVDVKDVSAEYGISLFPNPTSGELNVRIDGIGAGHSIVNKLYDAIGRLVFEKTQLSTTLTYSDKVNVADLASGVYLLQLQIDGKTILRKVTVQH